MFSFVFNEIDVFPLVRQCRVKSLIFSMFLIPFPELSGGHIITSKANCTEVVVAVSRALDKTCSGSSGLKELLFCA